MKHGCTFYLDKEKNGFCPINVAVTYSGNRLRYYIGYRIKKENFPVRDNYGNIISYEAKKNCIGLEGKSIVKYNSINWRINEITSELSKLFEPSRIPPDKIIIIEKLNEICKKTENVINNNIDTFWQTLNRFGENVEVSPLSRKQIKSVIKHFKDFELSLNADFTFDSITGETIKSFERWLKDGTRGRNYICNVLKKLQRFFTWSINDQKMRKVDISIKNPFIDFKITPELYGTPIVMKKSERDYLLDFEFDNERHKKVRDIFIFQCFCGARISDLMKLTKSNLQDDILRYVPMKTAKENMRTVEIPLNKKAIKILKRYNDPEGYLLPRMTDVEINRTLKTVFETAKLNRLVEHLDPKTELIEFIPLYKVATTHLARRTFAGLMYAAGQKDDIIASMTGHSENSKAFTRYRAIDMDLKKKATKNQ